MYFTIILQDKPTFFKLFGTKIKNGRRKVDFLPDESYNSRMKVFKYKFSKLMTVLIYAGLVLCALGFALNIYLVCKDGIRTAADPVYPILQYTLMFFITVVLGALLIGILFSSYYAIDGSTLKTAFGLIRSKYDIGKIELILLDRKTEKLSVTFSDGSFIVIVVRQEWYNDFIEAILAVNPAIEYSIQSKEPDKKDGE